MTRDERRIEVLRLTKPVGVSVPDMPLWLGMADQLDAWIMSGAGQLSPESPAVDRPDRKRQSPDTAPKAPPAKQ